jgi:hypothetical protein
MTVGWVGRWAAGTLTALVLAAAASAAQVPTRPDSAARARADSIARQDSLARTRADSIARQDSLRRDTTKALMDTLPTRRTITWDQPDSVMSALLNRVGYSVTRYQGNSVTFTAPEHQMLLRGRAQVARDSAVLLGDTIQFNDSTQIIEARGDTVLLRDPSRGPDDVIGQQRLRYDVTAREGLAYGVSTAVESGERWIVHGAAAAFKGDTTANGVSTFYARGGRFTACTDPNPHFHFAASEIKMISKDILVARPAVMYIADIPVLWLPFIFQDVRTGRRSGLIPPRIGASDIIRNRSGYRRLIENFGFYFALNNYMDAELTMDWLSGARPDEGRPGFVRVNGRLRYAWRDRFLDGSLGISQQYQRDGSSNQMYSLTHQQRFSERTSVNAALNYVTNTRVQRNTTFDPYAAVQAITSNLNISTGRGPFSVTMGGTQKQYPGRDFIERSFPTLNIRSRPMVVGDWFTWTPTLTLSSNENLHIDQAGEFAYRYVTTPGGGIDSVALDRSSRNTTITFDTPVQIFGFDWRNSFSVSDRLNDFPEKRTIVAVNDTSQRTTRVFRRTFITEVNWQTGFALPSFSQGAWNVSPTVSIQKVDPAGLLVRSERTGGTFVSQSLRPAFGLNVSPTLYRRLPGIGPVAVIRHSISPTLGFTYVPRGDVSDAYLEAIGRTRVGYLGANQQKTLNLGLNTVFEAKLRPSIDTIPEERWQKIKLLSLGFSSLNWDFERAKATGGSGLKDHSFDVTARSDLLPGFDIGVGWSLFQGDPISDTAVFKPYRESIRGSLSLGPASPIVRGLARLLGINVSEGSSSGAPGTAPPQAAPLGASPTFVAGQPISGGISRLANQMAVPSGQGWQWSLTYSARRTRPPSGTGVIEFNPEAECAQYLNSLLVYESCIQQASAVSGPNGPGQSTTVGGTYYVTPAQVNAQSTLSFHITRNWGAQWATTYDFTRKEFASQIFTLTREMHDWNASFAFMRAPNGNFTFNFHISLKAQPELKFDWDTRDYDRLGGISR